MRYSNVEMCHLYGNADSALDVKYDVLCTLYDSSEIDSQTQSQ